MSKLRSLLTVACLLTVVPPFLAETTDEARTIIEKAVEAQGGEDKVAKLQRMRLRLRGLMNEPELGETLFRLEVLWQLPDCYRSMIEIVTEEGGLVRTVVINGDKGLMSLNGQVQVLAGNALKEAKDAIYAETVYKLFPLLEDKKYVLSVFHSEKVLGRPTVGVKVESRGHQDVYLSFDKKTGLLLKGEHRMTDYTGEEVFQEVIFDKYVNTRGGPKHWSKVTVYTNRKKILEAEVVEVRFFDKKLDEKLFAAP